MARLRFLRRGSLCFCGALQAKAGGEDRNRTCPGSCEPTTVLKTARATRHPSLSEELQIVDLRLQIGENRQSIARTMRGRNYQEAFLIALTMASKSGQSPESSLEWSNLPLARISKAPPPEGMSVSDLMRSPSSRILVAKLTAFGV